MDENEQPSTAPVAQAGTLEQLAAFWAEQDIADYMSDSREVAFSMQQQAPHVAIAPTIYTQIARHARTQGIAPETIINIWLLERLNA